MDKYTEKMYLDSINFTLDNLTSALEEREEDPSNSNTFGLNDVSVALLGLTPEEIEELELRHRYDR